MMQGYVGYIRVSTPKQGEGVSLLEQRDAILRYTERNHFSIGLWLEEKETAAKRGRPVFNQAMRLLRRGQYRGIILHKLDRGARNLKDWADLGELVDQGVEVHFVNESLDLQTRGGRLSADIQAVVSADYIRNLREETRKGFYGRLKQGLYPLPAPIGYVDHGKGKPKTIDPVTGPLVRKAFELYSTTRYNLITLGDELYRLGLRGRTSGRVTRNGLSTVLNNTFYIGVIQIKKTNESFAGNHEPLIGKSLFDRVQKVLTGKMNARTQRHDFMFRRLLCCATCGYSLVGERQKGHVYYRCHGAHIPRASVREETVEAQMVQLLQRLRYSEEEKEYFTGRILEMKESWATQREIEIQSVKLQLDQIRDRRNRLTDAYLDQVLDKSTFEERKTSLLFEQKAVEEKLTNLSHNSSGGPDRLQKFLELAGSALLSYQSASPDEKREMVTIVSSNRQVQGKTLELEPSFPFRLVANRSKSTYGDPERIWLRTWDQVLKILAELNSTDQLPDLSRAFGCRDWDQDSDDEIMVKG